MCFPLLARFSFLFSLSKRWNVFLFYIFSLLLLINPYKLTQERGLLRPGEVKSGVFIE